MMVPGRFRRDRVGFDKIVPGMDCREVSAMRAAGVRRVYFPSLAGNWMSAAAPQILGIRNPRDSWRGDARQLASTTVARGSSGTGGANEQAPLTDWSNGITDPVIMAQSSEAMKLTALATSDGSSSRPKGRSTPA